MLYIRAKIYKGRASGNTLIRQSAYSQVKRDVDSEEWALVEKMIMK
ncbi:hypothetical protein T02_15108 [Trichinella nativa]|uniref:Uncharacterized protein n=1 Tax=Trichinella nativa TaxID=6335 RepID=A0A0V1KIX2_9BILA|nr:hypothetical protein T02_15108 [Trichinella nativa]